MTELMMVGAANLSIEVATSGCAACVADILTFPLDTAKVRLQIEGELGCLSGYRGVVGTLTSIFHREGVSGLYCGLLPGLQRQLLFSAIRIGTYHTVKEFYQNTTGFTSDLGLILIGICAGISTGSLATLVAQPTDVVKIRLQAQGVAGVEAHGSAGVEAHGSAGVEAHGSAGMKVRNGSRYNGIIHAYVSIAREEGLRAGLYRGTLPNMARNSVINVGEVVVYDGMKEFLESSGRMSGVPCHLVSALTCGFTATILASPIDVIKTRFINSPEGLYRNALHCARESAKHEGLSAFYRGFVPSFLRLVSANVVLWLTYEQLKIFANKYY